MDQNPHHPLDPIAHEIWDMKYRLKTADGMPVDQTPEESWQRVARAVAEAEAKADRERWAKIFHGILADYRYLPAGRILAGAGSERARRERSRAPGSRHRVAQLARGRHAPRTGHLSFRADVRRVLEAGALPDAPAPVDCGPVLAGHVRVGDRVRPAGRDDR